MAFRFEELEVWQMARAFSDSVYQLAARFPEAERYSLGSQITRAANSICLNVAEGAVRGSSADFNRFLLMARGSVFEVASALILAADRGYLDKPAFDELYDKADKISRSITNFRRSLPSE